MITIVDYAINNLHSVQNAFRSLKIPSRISQDPETIRSASKLILPGVGAFADAMENLRSRKLVELLREKAADGTPLLGLCLGLQLLFSDSEEFGPVAGLGCIPGRVRKLPPEVQVPHIGWNQLHLRRSDPLLEGVTEGSFVYFVHSYYADPVDAGHVVATTDYGIDFTAVTRKGNVWATQFHPEKSQDVGLRILRNFAGL
ncbi:MAG: imidazole glycerol phosphate synthase subunit HisH [Acidobacteria bacterium]|nr:imidazole glycerol phosphate synthase subunit HisH [Acidobacteriota bacterium]